MKTQIKQAIQFERNAGRKSAKAKRVRLILIAYKSCTIDEAETINQINMTKPWPAHAPINN